MSDNNYEYEIKEDYGKVDISENWEIRVTKTCWYNNKAKYDIRRWSKDGRPGKGITINENQLDKIFKILEKNIINPNDSFEVNDVVENIINRKRGKVKEVVGDYLIVNPSDSKDSAKWKKSNCKFIKKGRITYQNKIQSNDFF